MRTSIALIPALAVAAALRPGAEFPAVPTLPTPPPSILLEAPLEVPVHAGVLEALAGALLSATPHDAPCISEIIPLGRPLDSTEVLRLQEKELLELMTDAELWREGLRAESRMQFTRGMHLASRLLERDAEHEGARQLLARMTELRRIRLDAYRKGAWLDPETWEDLAPDEWKDVAEAVLDNRRLSVRFENALMADALAEVRAETGLPLILDAKVVGRIEPDLRVTVRASNVTARQAIRFILDQSEWWLEIAVIDEKVVLLRSDRDSSRY
jgi:hypothetical protein